MSRIDQQELLASWAASAARMDEFVLVSDLLEATARAGGEGLEVERARAAVLAERPALAAGLLADVDRSVLTTRTNRWTDVIAMAAWAAQGDPEALAALIRAGQGLHGAEARTHGYLLAAAAEQADQAELADRTWRDVAAIATPTMTVTRRLLVADVLGRSRSDTGSAGATVARSARALVEMLPIPEEHVRPVRDVVTRLEARGDPAGAWLLLEAVAALRPTAREVEVLRRERATGRGWWRSRVPGFAAAVGAAATLSAVGLTGAPMWVGSTAVLAAMAVGAWWRLPQGAGLSRVDARVLADLRALPADVVGRLSPASRRFAARTTAGTVAFFVTIIAAGLLVTGPLAELNRTHTPAVDAVVWPLVLLATVLGAAAGPRVLRRAVERDAGRWVDQVRTAVADGVRGCCCVRTVGMRSTETDAYVAGHLRPADADLAAAAPTIASGTLAVHQCPLSQTPWLSVRSPDREALLLRGSLVHATDPSDAGAEDHR